MNRLRQSERCPIHKRFDCCGRKPQGFVRKVQFKQSVTRIPDEFTEKGYREICSPAELRRRKDRKIREQNGRCYFGGEELQDYREVELHHIKGRKMGGGFRDDSMET